MTDRAQPGAIDSLLRNDELAQILGQFSEGWIAPGTSPTPAAQRRADVDDTALDAFSLTTSTTSHDVTVAPGEAFVSGWCVRDVSTTLTLPANATSEIVVGWDLDAVYNSSTDADRDAADKTIVARRANVSTQYPAVGIFEVTTDGSGVTSVSDLRNIGATLDKTTYETTSASEIRSIVSQSTETLKSTDLRLLRATAELFFQNSLGDLQFQDGDFEIFADTDDITGGANPPVFKTGVGGYASLLTGAADLSTASFTTSTDPFLNAGTFYGVTVTPDGEKLVVSESDDGVTQFQLTTPYDISSSSSDPDGSLEVSFNDSEMHDPTFADDGNLFFIGYGNYVYKYELSTSYDITTATEVGDRDFSEVGSAFDSFQITDNGTTWYVLYDNEIQEYTLPDPYDFSSLFNYVATRYTFSAVGNAGGMDFSEDGETMVVADGDAGEFRQYSLSTPFDPSTASDTGIVLPSQAQSTDLSCAEFIDGDFTLLDVGLDTINSYDLTETITPPADFSTGVSLDFTPTSVVVEDTTNPELTVSYDISDGNGNTVTVVDADVGTIVDTSALTSRSLTVDVTMDTTTVTADDQLEDFALYFDN